MLHQCYKCGYWMLLPDYERHLKYCRISNRIFLPHIAKAARGRKEGE